MIRVVILAVSFRKVCFYSKSAAVTTKASFFLFENVSEIQNLIGCTNKRGCWLQQMDGWCNNIFFEFLQILNILRPAAAALAWLCMHAQKKMGFHFTKNFFLDTLN
jgi:hypothetical protein